MISRLLVLLLVVSVLAPMQATSASESPCRAKHDCTQPTSNDDGWDYEYEEGDVVSTPKQKSGGSDGPKMEYLYTPFCQPLLDYEAGIEENCRAAPAPFECPDEATLKQEYYREAGSDLWLVGELRCIGGTRTPVGPALARARQELEARVLNPEFVLQPADGYRLANLPLIVHVANEDRVQPRTDCAHEHGVCFPVEIPLPGRLEAYPTYDWTFEPGIPPFVGRGVAYQEGVSPRDNPDFYVAYAYQSLGPKTVTLRVVWRATFTIDGLAPVRIEPNVVRTASQQLVVQQQRSQHVAGDR